MNSAKRNFLGRAAESVGGKAIDFIALSTLNRCDP